MKLSFVVPGPPQPKERPRRGRGGRFYTPGATRSYEEALKLYALAAVRASGWPLGTRAPVAVTVRAYFPDERRRDLDNAIKCLDGASGVIWHDDSQIVEWHVYRGVDRARPRLEVLVELRVENTWQQTKHGATHGGP